MEKYVGMDVHGQSCTAVLLDRSGRRMRQDVVDTNGQELLGYLARIGGPVRLCIEETEWSSWLWELVRAHVAEMVVVRGERRLGSSKSDALDAQGLADRLRTNRLGHPVYKAPQEFSRLREQARLYWSVTQDLTRAKNRLKSALRRRGIRCGGTRIYRAEGREEGLSELPWEIRASVSVLGRYVDQLVALKAEVESAMVEEAHRHRISRILETAPGMGPIRVAQVLPIVVTPYRFRTKRQYWSYCGFGIVTYSSADWVRVGSRWVRSEQVRTRGLNRNRHPRLKMIYKGAATTVIQHRGGNPFRTAYERLCEQGTKPNLAKVTVARKIAATTLAMWKNQEVYDPKR